MTICRDIVVMELISSQLILLFFIVLWALRVNLISILDLLSDLGFTVEGMHVRLTKYLTDLILDLFGVRMIVKTILLVSRGVKVYIL